MLRGPWVTTEKFSAWSDVITSSLRDREVGKGLEQKMCLCSIALVPVRHEGSLALRGGERWA